MSLKFQSAFNALERINGRTVFTSQSFSQSFMVFRDDPSNLIWVRKRFVGQKVLRLAKTLIEINHSRNRKKTMMSFDETERIECRNEVGCPVVPTNVAEMMRSSTYGQGDLFSFVFPQFLLFRS